MGHGPFLLSAGSLSDAAIFLSYFSIPLTLTFFVVKQDLQVSYFTDVRLKRYAMATVVLTVLFIAFCGLTHFAGFLSSFMDASRAVEVLKVITAVISVATTLFLVHVLPLFLNFIAALELTKRGLPEEMLRRHENIYNSSGTLISTHEFTADAAIFHSINPAWREFGYTSDALRGLSFFDIIMPDDHAAVTQALRTVQEHPLEAVSLEYRLRLHGGGTASAESTVSTCMEETRVFMLITRDISTRLEREQEEQKHQRFVAESLTRQNYISSIAHDLKTPLATFQLSVDLLVRGLGLSSEQRQILDEATVAIELLNITVAQAIDFARIMDTKRLQPRRTAVFLPSLIQKCSMVLEGYAKEVPLHFHLAGEIVPHVLTDGDWIWQMLVNLLTNACKHTAFGSIKLVITLENAATGAAAEAATISPAASEYRAETPPGISAKSISCGSAPDAGSTSATSPVPVVTPPPPVMPSPPAMLPALLRPVTRFHGRTVAPAPVELRPVTAITPVPAAVLAAPPAPAAAASPAPTRLAARQCTTMTLPRPVAVEPVAVWAATCAVEAVAGTPSPAGVRAAAPGTRPEDGGGADRGEDGADRGEDAPWGGAFLRFSVHDTGIGVPDDCKAMLFKPFSQVQARQGQGTGLGLYSVRQKAIRLGGYCGVSDAIDGPGSIFYFCVPYVPEDDSGVHGKFLSSEMETRTWSGTSGITGTREGSSTSNLSSYIQSRQSRRHRHGSFLLVSDHGANFTAQSTICAQGVSGDSGAEDDVSGHGDADGSGRPPGASGPEMGVPSGVGGVRCSGLSGGLSRHMSGISAISDDSGNSDGIGDARPCVLIVDDTLTVRSLLSRAVEKMGLRTVQAKNGAVALEALMSERFLLTFCDLQMPIMDGLECVRRFRDWEAKARPGQRKQVILAMSANHDDTGLCYTAGMNGFCPKPVKMEVLQRVIDHYKALPDADWPRLPAMRDAATAGQPRNSSDTTLLLPPVAEERAAAAALGVLGEAGGTEACDAGSSSHGGSAAEQKAGTAAQAELEEI